MAIWYREYPVRTFRGILWFLDFELPRVNFESLDFICRHIDESTLGEIT